MARKAETGLQYFPINSDIVFHRKIKLITAQFGAEAWAVIIALLCKIHRERGYFIDWEDDEMKILFAQDECKCNLNFVEKVVTGCVKRRLFSEKLFDTFGILTSDRIQDNFLEGKRRNKSVEMIKEFLLYDDNVYNEFDNVNILPLSVNIITKKVDIGTQNKKEKKNKIIEGEGKGDNAHTKEEKELFKNFQEYVSKHAPDVARLKEPLTIDQYLKLRARIPKETLIQLVTAMHNKKDLLSKYNNAYLTILAWYARDEKSNGHKEPEFDAREADSRKILNGIKKNRQ